MNCQRGMKNDEKEEVDLDNSFGSDFNVRQYYDSSCSRPGYYQCDHTGQLKTGARKYSAGYWS